MIKLSSPKDAATLSNFYLSNAEHLRQWEPLRRTGFHLESEWKQRLEERAAEQQQGRAAYFISYDPTTSEIVAVCSLTNIIKGAFQAANMSYAIAERHQGIGKMKQLCQYVIKYAFENLELHRIMANYMPSNQRSAALLNSLGFAKEGTAKDYLLINGLWEDHVLTSLINHY